MDIIKDFGIKEICDFKIYKLSEEEKAAKEQKAKTEREKWFKIEPIFKEVSKEEFEDFVKAYPRKLNFDIYRVYEPPAISYNDFELANRWPYSIIASTMYYPDDLDDYYYTPPKDRHYKILVNYKELFDARTGYRE